ncbi:hypothetical protein DPV79_40590, partial [Burkholderia reimsis]
MKIKIEIWFVLDQGRGHRLARMEAPLAISDIVRANLSVDCGVKERHFAAITSVDVLIILGSVAST